MIESDKFKLWLTENKSYSANSIRDIVSRMKRADQILEWSNEEVYLFWIEKQQAYMNLGVDIKSQIRKAIQLYWEFSQSK